MLDRLSIKHIDVWIYRQTDRDRQIEIDRQVGVHTDTNLNIAEQRVRQRIIRQV